MDFRALDFTFPFLVTVPSYILNTLVAPASRGFIYLVVIVAKCLQNYALVISSTLSLHLVFVVAECLNHYAPWWLRWDITLSAISFVAESTSAALEQTSAYKLKAAEYGLILAIVSLILLLADLIYKHQHRKKANKDDPRRHQSSGDGWDFADTFGSVSSVLVLISASLHYHYLSSGKQQPIRFSMLPLAFSVCVFCSRVFRPPAVYRKSEFFMVCRHFGRMILEVDSGGALCGTDGSTEFSCPICHLHPQDV